MLHLLYILAFTLLAVLAVANLIRNLMTLGIESQRSYGASPNASHPSGYANRYSRTDQPIHPELLDDTGKVVNEPFLVMRSITVEDARERLDALYNASPGSPSEPQEE